LSSDIAATDKPRCFKFHWFDDVLPIIPSTQEGAAHAFSPELPRLQNCRQEGCDVIIFEHTFTFGPS
jgi:hypothetical protein